MSKPLVAFTVAIEKYIDTLERRHDEERDAMERRLVLERLIAAKYLRCEFRACLHDVPLKDQLVEVTPDDHTV